MVLLKPLYHLWWYPWCNFHFFFLSLHSSVSLPQSYSCEIPPHAYQISRLFPFPCFFLEAIQDGPVCLLRSHIFYLDLFRVLWQSPLVWGFPGAVWKWVSLLGQSLISWLTSPHKLEIWGSDFQSMAFARQLMQLLLCFTLWSSLLKFVVVNVSLNVGKIIKLSVKASLACFRITWINNWCFYISLSWCCLQSWDLLKWEQWAA